MWIRTQDREMLMNCSAVGIGLEDPNTIFSGGYVMGTYSSKEKAMKVLDSIERHIDTIEEFASQGSRGNGSIRLLNFVFQMPFDIDVK